jgi:hypothetical protein
MYDIEFILLSFKKVKILSGEVGTSRKEKDEQSVGG